MLANLSAYGSSVAAIAITAPGRDVLPDAAAMRTWNNSAPERWRALHRAARQQAARRVGSPPRLLVWSWEYQKRGALHKHIVVGAGTALELAAAYAYVEALDALRHAHGFGFVDRGKRDPTTSARRLELIPADRAGRYLAKYLSPLDASGKPTLTETVRHADVPPLVVYVSRTLTASTGITMRYLRRVRLAHVLGFDPDTGELLARRPIARLVPAGDLVTLRVKLQT